MQGALQGAVNSGTTARMAAANGLPRAAAKAGSAISCRRDPAPVIQAARMLVRERKPVFDGEIEWHREMIASSRKFFLPEAFLF